MTEGQVISIMAAIIYAVNKGEHGIHEQKARDQAADDAFDIYNQVSRTAAMFSS